MAVAIVVEDASVLAEHVAGWDSLAMESRRPYSAPGWALAWWANMRPGDARLRVVLVEDRGTLIGVAPFSAHGGEYSLIGCDHASGVEPLVAHGREREVAATIMEQLAAARPRLRQLRLLQQGSVPGWSSLLADGWPGQRPWQRELRVESSPLVSVAGMDFDIWLKGRSRNFRQAIRRRLRQLEDDGGSFRIATLDTLDRDVGELMRLHRARLAGRGGSMLTDPRVEAVLTAAGRDLIPKGRFRLLTVELGERAIGAQLFLIARDQVSYWNGGFDEGYGQYSPSMLGLVKALELACELDGSLDLGPGAQDYKRRFTDEEVLLTSHLLVPHGRGYLRTRLYDSMRLRATAARRRVIALRST